GASMAAVAPRNFGATDAGSKNSRSSAVIIQPVLAMVRLLAHRSTTLVDRRRPLSTWEIGARHQFPEKSVPGTNFPGDQAAAVASISTSRSGCARRVTPRRHPQGFTANEIGRASCREAEEMAR